MMGKEKRLADKRKLCHLSAVCLSVFHRGEGGGGFPLCVCVCVCLIAKGNLAFGIVVSGLVFLVYVNSPACSFCDSVMCANSPRRKC